MAQVDIKKSVLGFAFVAFLLLAILFGMQIMTFMFGQLGESAIDTLDADSISVASGTGAWINATTYTIPAASLSTFLGGFSVSAVYNVTGAGLISAGNYTVDADAGTMINASAEPYPNVNITYTYNRKSQTRQTTESVNNDSLQSISTYTEQSGTQMSTIAIAITLVILIALFLLFWNIFIGKKGNKMGDNFS